MKTKLTIIQQIVEMYTLVRFFLKRQLMLARENRELIKMAVHLGNENKKLKSDIEVLTKEETK